MSSGDISLAIERAIACIDSAIHSQDIVVHVSTFAAHFNLSGVLMIAPTLKGDVSRPELIVSAAPADISLPMSTEPDLANGVLRAISRARESARVWSPDQSLSAVGEHLAPLASCFDADMYSHGVIVTATGASGLAGAVIMGGGQPLDDIAVAYLKLMATYALDRACALQRAEVRNTYGLSDREFECMKWVAAGKTDWEIGQILTISPKTVNYHVENAKRKMSVQTRVQAVVSALLSGGISE